MKTKLVSFVSDVSYELTPYPPKKHKKANKLVIG